MKKLLPRLALCLLLADVLLVLLSWLMSAMPTVEVRSLLTGEGIRWLLGHSCDMIATPLLAWIVLLGMGVGCLRASGLLTAFSRAGHRDRVALWSTGVLLVLYVVVLLLLTAVPHAILLSATGDLFPSPFSASLVPCLAFGLCLLSIVYGVMSGRFSTLSDIYEALLSGLRSSAVFILFYVLLIQLYYTVSFVFMINLFH